MALALALIGLIVFWSLKTGSPPTPTSPSVRRTMMALLPERLPGHHNGSIVELGSGWGGVAFALAKRYPLHPVIGYELSIIPWAVSRARLLVQPQANLNFRKTDFMRANLTESALVICYLMPETMVPLADRLERGLPNGALVLCNTFALPNWRALDQVNAPDMYSSPVYLYEKNSP